MVFFLIRPSLCFTLICFCGVSVRAQTGDQVVFPEDLYEIDSTDTVDYNILHEGSISAIGLVAQTLKRTEYILGLDPSTRKSTPTFKEVYRRSPSHSGRPILLGLRYPVVRNKIAVNVEMVFPETESLTEYINNIVSASTKVTHNVSASTFRVGANYNIFTIPHIAALIGAGLNLDQLRYQATGGGKELVFPPKQVASFVRPFLSAALTWSPLKSVAIDFHLRQSYPAKLEIKAHEARLSGYSVKKYKAYSVTNSGFNAGFNLIFNAH